MQGEETLDHALRLCDLLAIDLARLDDGTSDASRCAEFRLSIVNWLLFRKMKDGLEPSVTASKVETRPCPKCGFEMAETRGDVVCKCGERLYFATEDCGEEQLTYWVAEDGSSVIDSDYKGPSVGVAG